MLRITLAEETRPNDLGNAPFGKHLANVEKLPVALGETDFEKARGVNKIEIRTGFASARITGLDGEVSKHRLRILNQVYQQEISLDFLKFSGDGMSFVVPDYRRDELVKVLEECGSSFEVKPDRAVLIVHAVNMRDEEGLVASIVSQVIEFGANIEHLGEMHDRLLMLMGVSGAEKARDGLKARYPGAQA